MNVYNRLTKCKSDNAGRKLGLLYLTRGLLLMVLSFRVACIRKPRSTNNNAKKTKEAVNISVNITIYCIANMAQWSTTWCSLASNQLSGAQILRQILRYDILIFAEETSNTLNEHFWAEKAWQPVSLHACSGVFLPVYPLKSVYMYFRIRLRLYVLELTKNQQLHMQLLRRFEGFCLYSFANSWLSFEVHFYVTFLISFIKSIGKAVCLAHCLLIYKISQHLYNSNLEDSCFLF